MAAVGVRHIYGLYSELAERSLFVSEVARCDIGRDAEVGVVLQQVDVAFEHTRHARCVGHHAEQAAQVDVLHAQSDVLACLVVGRGIECQSCAVGTCQPYVCRDAVAAVQAEVVVRIHTEGAVCQHRIQRVETQAQRLVDDGCVEAEVHA